MNAQQVLSDPELVAARQAWEQRLRDHSGAPIYLQGRPRTGDTSMYEDPEKCLGEALEKLAEFAELLKDTAVFRPIMVGAGLHGVHFMDKIFGAEVYELDGEKGNWQAKYLSTPVGSLERPDLEANQTWRAAREFAIAFVNSGVTVPVLSLPTIASALNVGLNLYGQDLLLTMMVDPPAVHHDLDIINRILLDIHEWYRANVPFDLLHQVAAGGRYQAPGCGQICGCSTQLIAVGQYDEFVASHDDAVLSGYPNGGLIHLCGTHTQHNATWMKMASMTAVQLNDRASEDLEIYLREMPDKTYYVHPCDGMPLDKVEELAKTHRIVICAEPSR